MSSGSAQPVQSATETQQVGETLGALSENPWWLSAEKMSCSQREEI